MAQYSICIIDDKIPTDNFVEFMDEYKLLNENNFKHLLIDYTEWKDKPLFNLSQQLFDNDTYSISGFKSHKFYLNYISENVFNPDVIIYDWDIVGESMEDSLESLQYILEKQYCLVAIYTEANQDNQVSNALSDDIFLRYFDSGRLHLFQKEDGIEELSKVINEHKNNFSFKLGKNLKLKTIVAIDNILNNFSELSFEQYVSLFGINQNGKKILSDNDFVDLFLNKLKYELNNLPFEEELTTTNVSLNDPELIRRLWSYRLFHFTNDDVIRKGDILKKGEDEEKLFLVLSSDCHLSNFLNKTLGHLALIPLYRLDPANVSFKKRLNYRPNSNLSKIKINSLISPTDIDFLTILPGIPIDKQKYYDYAINTRECFSVEVNIENGQGKPLLAKDLAEYEKIVSISEPFLSALHQFIIQNYSGIGVPNFSDELITYMNKKIQELKK